MINVSILLVGGDLDGQTYTAKEGEKTVRIHNSEKKDVVTDTEIREKIKQKPEGKWYIYEQEREGSERFLFKHSE